MNEKTVREWSKELYRLLFIICFSVVLVLASYLIISSYRNSDRARVALAEAQVVKLAIMVESNYCFGLGNDISDSTTGTGFTEKSYRNISEMIQFNGDYKFHLLQVDDNGYDVLAFSFTSGDFVAVYDNTKGLEEWKVYKTNNIID